MPKPEDVVISLFSGAGGMSYGFSTASFTPSLAAEIDEDACETYRRNVSGNILNEDLSEPSAKFRRELTQYRGAFALIGGPPCQGFSSAGTKNAGDSRNRLIFNYLQIVEDLRPRWFLFENVEGLLTSNNGASVAALVREFMRIGYYLRLEKVNFASYGLPQARKRVIIIGNRLNIEFRLPTPTHAFNGGKHKGGGRGLPMAPSFNEALSGLGPAVHRGSTTYSSFEASNPYDALMREGNSQTVEHHVFSPPKRYLLAAVERLKPGQTMKDLPEEFWHDSFRRRAFRRVMDGTPTERRGGAPSGIKRLDGSLNSLTITSAATREFIHPTENRGLTLREAARLQSFPDFFNFAGRSSDIIQQIGNAFPPIAARAIAKHIALLDGRAGSSLGQPSAHGKLLGYHLTDALGMSPALASTERLLNDLAFGELPLEIPEMHRRAM